MSEGRDEVVRWCGEGIADKVHDAADVKSDGKLGKQIDIFG